MRTNRKPFDPLDFVPDAAVIRKNLEETESLAERLRILLEVAERIELAGTVGGEQRQMAVA